MWHFDFLSLGFSDRRRLYPLSALVKASRRHACEEGAASLMQVPPVHVKRAATSSYPPISRSAEVHVITQIRPCRSAQNRRIQLILALDYLVSSRFLYLTRTIAVTKSISGCAALNFSIISSFFCSSDVGLPIIFAVSASRLAKGLLAYFLIVIILRSQPQLHFRESRGTVQQRAGTYHHLLHHPPGFSVQL